MSRQRSLRLYSMRNLRNLAIPALASSGANAPMPPVSLFATDAASQGILRGLVIADEVVGIISVKE